MDISLVIFKEGRLIELIVFTSSRKCDLGLAGGSYLLKIINLLEKKDQNIDLFYLKLSVRTCLHDC